MAIILDAMGSDDYPYPEILGTIEAQKEVSEDIVLVGDEKIIKDKMRELTVSADAFEIIHAPEVVEMWEKPVEAAKNKPNNSMAVGIKLVKEGRGKAFVTAGNTGGAMFNGLRVLGRIKGVQRPALSALYPTRKSTCVVLDIGANADCRPDFLLEFAVMGSIYATFINGIAQPKIGLLSNGEEAGKGNQLIKDSFKLLEKSELNFIGNVEPKELFAGEADVVVTDGFTGNVLTKSSEAIAKFFMDLMKEALMGSLRTKMGAMLAKPAFAQLKAVLDPSEIGAVPLLGLDGLVFVGHGRSDPQAIKSSILIANKAIQENLIGDVREKIGKALGA